ncbi:hypothetical protein EJB05_02890 [Eragrostis curvula]|uniref:Uncharacterized protein n=1 Tax=Eragrostis curvula TaxID=38414 RepID=A0A5J9WTL7_9POAL|nr:hypothetical protein EJB05_02890 [Eragrostis curvula]
MVEATGAPAATAPPPPTLLSLCLDAVAASLTRHSAGRTGWPGGCSNDGLVGFTDEGGGEEEEEEHLSPEQVADALPWELLHQLAARLPPVALESLHHAAQARCCFSSDTNAGLGGPDGKKHGMKRSRHEDFNTAWQALFKLRWPLDCNPWHSTLASVDWQQQYWEKHLQEFVIKDL